MCAPLRISDLLLAAITRSANASSAGSIARVDFYANSPGTHTLIGTTTTATGGVYTFNWANVPAGSYSP